MHYEQTQRYFAGQPIFAEGQQGEVAYVILTGSVEIYTVRDGKRVSIRTLGPGACFGEMAVISGHTRSTSALALVPTELGVVAADQLQNVLLDNDPLTRTVVLSLVERLREETEHAVNAANGLNPVLATAMLLAMEGKLQLSQSPTAKTGGGGLSRGGALARGGTSPAALPPPDMVELSHARAVRLISELLGFPRTHVRSIFKTMAGMNLLNLLPPSQEPKLQFRPHEIVKNAENIVKSFGDMVEQRLRVDSEFIDIEELAENFGVSRTKLYKKIMRAEFPDDMIAFRKLQAMEAYETYGRPFFEELKPKDPRDFDHINDIEYVPLALLKEEARQFEPYSLAVLIKFQEEEETRSRLLSALSTNMRNVIEQTLKTVPSTEADQAEKIGLELLQRLQQRLLAQNEAKA